MGLRTVMLVRVQIGCEWRPHPCVLPDSRLERHWGHLLSGAADEGCHGGLEMPKGNWRCQGGLEMPRWTGDATGNWRCHGGLEMPQGTGDATVDWRCHGGLEIRLVQKYPTYSDR